MKFQTAFGEVNLTKEEVAIAEKLTALPRKLAVDEVCLTMAEEFVWPDEPTLKKYLKLLYHRMGTRIRGIN